MDANQTSEGYFDPLPISRLYISYETLSRQNFSEEIIAYEFDEV